MKSLFTKRETSFSYNWHYLLLQKKWADKMSRLTEGASRRKLIFLLVLFIALSAGYLLFNIYKVFAEGACPSFKQLQRHQKSVQTFKTNYYGNKNHITHEGQ